MFLEIAWQNKQFKISLSLLDFKQLLLDNGDIVQWVEEYVKDPKTENVEDENVKDAEAEKIRRADVSNATFALLWSLRRKETVETLPWNEKL